MDKNKTIIKSEEKTIKWYIFDAKDYKLGRLVSKVAHILRNKNKSIYLPYDTDKSHIVIINSKRIQTTGKKNQQKTYKKHSGKPGGMKVEVFSKLQQRKPNKIIEHALKGMLPKNSLGRQLFKNVKIYAGDQHPHKAQNPIKININ